VAGRSGLLTCRLCRYKHPCLTPLSERGELPVSARRVWSYFWRFLNATSDEHRDTVDQGFGVTSGPCPPQSAQLLLRLGPLAAQLAARH